MRNFFFLFIIFMTQSAFSADSIHYEEVNSLPVFYKKIDSCGSWRLDSLTGYWRIVVVDTVGGVGSEIYVQSIIDPNPTQNAEAKILQTLKIKELNDDHAQYTIEAVRCKAKGARSVIEIEASYEHDEDDRKHKFLLTGFGGNQYKLKRVNRF